MSKPTFSGNRPRLFPFAVALLFVVVCVSTIGSTSMAQGNFYAVPLGTNQAGNAQLKITRHDGVPFADGSLKFSTNGFGAVQINGTAKRIFLRGMTESCFIGCWEDPTNQAVRFFIGDNLGQIRLDYEDGSADVYPLVLGENIWWGGYFYRSPGPFPTDARFRDALATSLHLYPPAPPKDGSYIAVITPRPIPLRGITVTNSPAKHGTPGIYGITIEPAGTDEIAGAVSVSPGEFTPEFKKFVETKSLRPVGRGERLAQKHLNSLRLALYSSDETFSKSRVVPQTPPGYAGPQVSFSGGLVPDVLSDAFKFNVQDIADKIDADGMYHTSTKGAVLWGDNGGQFGTYATNVGLYYGASWFRDMGRSLQEMSILGYTNDAAQSADYALRAEKLWADKGSPRVNGQSYPPHWSRVNRPNNAPPYENDGHGLMTMFLYKAWQRMPDRDAWLRARWPDVKCAGDWILWQFAHPEISGASNGVLFTTGECAHSHGHSVYADAACMTALRALAQKADSIGESNAAASWRDRAGWMQQAITENYLVDDPKYGNVWTLTDAGWPDKPTVLGPLIYTADYKGFAPQDDDPQWRPASEAAYQRLIDTYKPLGFYGWAMGYGQGFVIESALLLDRMHDATKMLEWVAKEIYDPRFGSFIVPEGVQLDPSGRFWYRAGDLGNGVQEAEIIKTLRLVIGIDDTQPDRIQFYPRLPFVWKQIAVEKYPVLVEQAGRLETTHLNYKLTRDGRKMDLEISCDKELRSVAMRLGPFEKRPSTGDVTVNGQHPAGAVVSQSGDSWWISFTRSIGPI